MLRLHQGSENVYAFMTREPALILLLPRYEGVDSELAPSDETQTLAEKLAKSHLLNEKTAPQTIY